MIIINEDKWDDMKSAFLSKIDYDFSEEPLVYFNHKTNEQQEIGTREKYTFTKNNMDFMIILDKEHRLNKVTTQKNGRQIDHYSRNPNEFTYKLSVKYREMDGSWKDSSAMENSFRE